MLLDDQCISFFSFSFSFFWLLLRVAGQSSFNGIIITCHWTIDAFFFGIVVFRRTIRILMTWSLRVAGWLMHLFCDFLRVTGKFVFWWHDHCVSQDDQCHFFFFFFCDCWVSQGNSSFDLWLLCFAKQFIFWFAIAAFRKAILLLDSDYCISQNSLSFGFAIAMFRKAIRLLICNRYILRLLCFAGQFIFWFCNYYVSQDNSSFNGMIVACRRTIKCIFFVCDCYVSQGNCLLMAWSLRVVEISMHLFCDCCMLLDNPL